MREADVLVIGAGFAGMSAALTTAGGGAKTVLLDSQLAPGGHFPLLENQFPTNSCGVCFLSPETPSYCPFIQCTIHTNIISCMNADIERVSGKQGDFTVTIRRKNNFVDNTRCIDCGKCAAVCPIEVPAEFGKGVETRKAIYTWFPNLASSPYFIDDSDCIRCNKCVEVCPTDAITFIGNETTDTLKVKEIIAAPGFSSGEENIIPQYGWGKYEQVISALQLERFLSASGPDLNKFFSCSTSVPKVAFLQCIGSRMKEKKGNPYCSSVCCMFALKQAMLIKTRYPHLEVTIFYMDLRTSGKDYEVYLRKAREKYNIRFVRYKIPELFHNRENDTIRIRYSCEDRFVEEEFSLVVLSVGFRQTEHTQELSKTLDIATNRYHFVETHYFAPNQTSVPGMYAAGSFVSPKDIPEATLDGKSAASLALASLRVNTDRGTGPKRRSEAEIEPIRLGVLLCTCREQIPHDLLSSLKPRDELIWKGTAGWLCSEDGATEIRKIFGEQALDRLVIACCSRQALLPVLETLFKDSGFSALQIEVADIKETLYTADHDKAVTMIEWSIDRVLQQCVPPVREREIVQRVLIVGGGIAGMTAALRLAEAGTEVVLVEKHSQLGGRLQNAFFTIDGSQLWEKLSNSITQIEEHPNITVYKKGEVTASRGEVGNRETEITTGEGVVNVQHGATILATGGEEVKPSSYGYGESECIITQSELEEHLYKQRVPARTHQVVMIQCVESRDTSYREYCSRVCCNHALKNSLRLKQEYPEVEITILYRDVRSYGFYEDYYRDAREAGVIFVPYSLEEKPAVEVSAAGLKVAFYEPILNTIIEIHPDLAVLSNGMQPKDTSFLSQLFGIPVDKNGFFTERNPKAALASTVKNDVFLAGLAHAPKHIDEAIVQAQAAAGLAMVFLHQGKIEAKERRAYTIERFCSSCGICVTGCPFEARFLDREERVAKVRSEICEGCGSCLMMCPNGAAQLYGEETRHALNALETLLK
jgi:heterodisulfide reductase subunit A